MKLFWSVAVYLLISLALGAGIVFLMLGKPALLIAAGLVYVLLFAKVGCASQ